MTNKQRLARTAEAPQIGIVHLGPGAFFRAFNAIYTEEAMAASGGDWGTLAVSLRSNTARMQLGPQGGVFTSVELANGQSEARVIGSIVDVLTAPDDPAAVVAAMARPEVKIYSLTITEKGYCHNPATGMLNMLHPDIAHDLIEPGKPRSAPGLIVAALAARRKEGTGGITVLSCDNLPSNGTLTAQVVKDFAQAVDPDLAKWVEAHVTFPATMVDRITPATTEADIVALGERDGYYDPGCVVHEAFRQWVIEDNFAAGRPDWGAAGAQLVASVEAHELMKLRCLNGTHSTLAYLGYLAGHETISDCVADPVFAGLCERLWAEEITPVLTQPDGESLPDYCAGLLARYRDPSIRHRTWQIAMDGSQKLPQRLLGTIADNLAQDCVPEGLCLAVAGWMRYVGGIDEAGAPIDVRDPLAERLKEVSCSAGHPAEALLGVTEVFGDLPRDNRFYGAVVAAYDQLTSLGSRAAVQAYTDR